jgi:hypothetical protein
LNASPAHLTAQLLVNGGYGFYPPLAKNAPASRYTVFINAFPDTPTNIISCTINGLNRNDGRLLEGTPIVHPGVQVRVRSNDMDDAYDKIKTIWLYASTVKRLALTVLGQSYRVDNLSPTEEPIYLGVGPDDQRPSFAFDLFVTYKKGV